MGKVGEKHPFWATDSSRPGGRSQMKVRFRIRTSAGQELSFPSRDVFEDFVRAGDLSPDDLIYDGESGSWAPARTHPAVIEIGYEREAVEAPRPDPSRPTPDTGSEDLPGPHPDREQADAGGRQGDASTADQGESSGAGEGDDLGLELAPEISSEEAKRAFVEKMQAERASELDADAPPRSVVEGFTMEDAATLAGRMGERPAPLRDGRSERPSSTSGPAGRPRREGGAARVGPQARKDSPIHRDRTGSTERVQHPRPMPKKRTGLSRVLAAGFIVALLGGGAYFTYGALGGRTSFMYGAFRGGDQGDPLVRPSADEPAPTPSVRDEPSPEVEPASDVAPPRPPAEPVIPQTTSAIRERAQERFLTATQVALRDLPPIPEPWATGPYLAAPSDFPDVLAVWRTYLGTIRRVRAEDTDRYRAAYASALDDAAIAGDVRLTVMEEGVSSLAENAQHREAHYDRVEALATAAIQSHNALVDVEGLVLYDGSSVPFDADGLGAGASGRDEESQLLLDRVVELLRSTLEADGEGPGTGANVRAWVWDGLLDAVAR